MQSLGSYISARRNTLRLTQEEVSERLRSYGIERTAPTIAKWETDKQPVPIELIPALAKALEDSPVRLYELAGVLAELPQAEILKLLDGLPKSELARIERMLRGYLQNS